MPTANVRNDRTGRITVVRKDTPEEALRQLSVILNLNGWQGDSGSLAFGERIQHRGHTYWTDSDGGEG